MMIDVARARRDTPGCTNVIHFNNAGAALMPQAVITAVLNHLRLESQIGSYEAAAVEQERLDDVYGSIADLLNCDRAEVAIVENATRAWDMFFYSLPLEKGDRILTSRAEYASNYIAMLHRVTQVGASIEAVPNDAHGQISIDALESMIDDRVRLIALTHVPTNGGLVNPAAAVGAVARRHGITYLLDACQSIGQMPIDVEHIGCDALSATSRKYLRGPRGVGFLYVRHPESTDPPLLDLHAARWSGPGDYQVRADAARFENWEYNPATRLGMGAAIDYALGWGLGTIQHFVTTLAELLRQRLEAIAGVTVTDLGRQKCGIVSFTTPLRPALVRDELRERGINVWTSQREATLLDMEERGLVEVVRASVHYYNTEREVERFCDAIQAILRGPALTG